MPYKIMLVDDEPANLRMLERLFNDDYQVVTALSGAEALELLLRHDVALIISDQRMPGMSGIEMLKQAARLRPHTARVMLTGYTDAGDLVEAINSGVVYRYLTKPWSNADLILTVRRALEHYETTKKQHLLGLENERLERRLSETIEGFLAILSNVVGAARPDVQGHCDRTAKYACAVAEQMGLSPLQVDEIRIAALLHELPNLKLSPDRPIVDLEPSQAASLRRGFDEEVSLISDIPDLEAVAEIVRYQHESYDGSGLFDGLDGAKIPLGSRVVAVANMFDEMRTEAPATQPRSAESVTARLDERAGRELDPEVVAALRELDLDESMGVGVDTAASDRAMPREQATPIVI
jgi:response regulator RpfG family c-di-GMP phosphodiesterase